MTTDDDKFKKKKNWRPRWQRSRWTWSTSLSMDTSGIHLQTQKCMWNTSWEQIGVPDQRGPSMWLRHQTAKKDPRQGSLLSALTRGSMEKDWPKKPSDHQLKEAQKKTLIGWWLLQWRQPVILYTWHHQGPCSQAAAPPSHSTLTGAELPQAKKKVLHLCAQGRYGHVWLLATLWTVACQGSLSGRGVLQARILERIGQYWVSYPSRALYFLLP